MTRRGWAGGFCSGKTEIIRTVKVASSRVFALITDIRSTFTMTLIITKVLAQRIELQAGYQKAHNSTPPLQKNTRLNAFTSLFRILCKIGRKPQLLLNINFINLHNWWIISIILLENYTDKDFTFLFFRCVLNTSLYRKALQIILSKHIANNWIENYCFINLRCILFFNYNRNY